MVESVKATEELDLLWDELAGARSAVLDIIKNFPDDLQAHRVYCAYVGKTSALHKIRVEARALDSAALLVGVLKCVILTLLEKEELECARTVGQYQEDIGEKVKEKWPAFKELDLTGALTITEALSTLPAHRLEKPRSVTGEDAGKEP